MRRILVIVALTACALVAWAGKGGGGKPGGGGGGSFTPTVVFTHGTEGQLQATDYDGSQIQTVTKFSVFSASWKPDGSGFVAATDVGGAGIYSLSASGKKEALLFSMDAGTAGDARPVWSVGPSPTGAQLIAYLDEDSAQRDVIYVGNTDGTNRTLLVPGQANQYIYTLDFHPSGSSIATAVYTGSSAEIVILELGLDGGGNVEVANWIPVSDVAESPLQGSGAIWPVFSRAGDKLAVLSGPAWRRDIYEIDLSDYTSVTNVTQGQIGVQQLGGYGPLDDEIYFTDNTTRTLHVINTDGTGLAQVFPDAPLAMNVALKP